MNCILFLTGKIVVKGVVPQSRRVADRRRASRITEDGVSETDGGHREVKEKYHVAEEEEAAKNGKKAKSKNRKKDKK